MIEKIVIVLIAVLVYAVGFIILALPVMLLWNWLMVGIFDLCKITWVQSLGLVVLSRLLFPTSISGKEKSSE